MVRCTQCLVAQLGCDDPASPYKAAFAYYSMCVPCRQHAKPCTAGLHLLPSLPHKLVATIVLIVVDVMCRLQRLPAN